MSGSVDDCVWSDWVYKIEENMDSWPKEIPQSAYAYSTSRAGYRFKLVDKKRRILCWDNLRVGGFYCFADGKTVEVFYIERMFPNGSFFVEGQWSGKWTMTAGSNRHEMFFDCSNLFTEGKRDKWFIRPFDAQLVPWKYNKDVKPARDWV